MPRRLATWKISMVDPQTGNITQMTLASQQLTRAVEQLMASEWQHCPIEPRWQRWLIENKLLYVADQLLVQTMVDNSINAQLATRAVQATTKAIQVATTALQVKPQLSQAWQQWLLENKALNISDDVLIQTMVQNGIDAQLAIQAVGMNLTQFSAPVISSKQPTTVAAQLLAKLESILAIKQTLAELSPDFGTIKRVESLSKQEFLDNYYATGTPVIITNMMRDWSAMASWSPEYLKSKYGNSQIEVQMSREADAEYEINNHHHKQTMNLGDYVDKVVNGGETNDYYMVANNQNLERDELKSLLNDIIFPDFLDSTQIQQRVFLWVGPAGTITPLHHDPLNVMMAHVRGRKRWRLVSPNYTPLLYNLVGVYSKVDLENPDYEKYPLFRQVKVIETVLEPGELIFVPVGWWHQVKGLDVSISVSFSNFAFPNEYDYYHPNIHLKGFHSPETAANETITPKGDTAESQQNLNQEQTIPNSQPVKGFPNFTGFWKRGDRTST